MPPPVHAMILKAPELRCQQGHETLRRPTRLQDQIAGLPRVRALQDFPHLYDGNPCSSGTALELQNVCKQPAWWHLSQKPRSLSQKWQRNSEQAVDPGFIYACKMLC